MGFKFVAGMAQFDSQAIAVRYTPGTLPQYLAGTKTSGGNGGHYHYLARTKILEVCKWGFL